MEDLGFFFLFVCFFNSVLFVFSFGECISYLVTTTFYQATKFRLLDFTYINKHVIQASKIAESEVQMQASAESKLKVLAGKTAL